MRVYELAKELNISSRELLNSLKEQGVDVKTHTAKLDPKTIEILRERFRPKKEYKILELSLPLTVKELSTKMKLSINTLIKRLMETDKIVNINQSLEEDTVKRIAQDLGFEIKFAPTEEELLFSIHNQPDSPETLKPRAPVVTLMGHVDHGKTSLLDFIRKSKITETEHGGITQHIGAYRIDLPEGRITFLDTPGHEAFTAMRARGAKITDIVVLVIAADEGVMPQTVEAIDHAKEANVPIVVAINKIDKTGADINKVKMQLKELGLVSEDWGGKTIMVPVSARTGKGIDNLLEMILLEAEMLELKANYNKLARGVIIEAKLSKGKGPLATFLVQDGTLHLNDTVICGSFFGKIRAMFDDRSKRIESVLPSMPVEVLGLECVPFAGEKFFVITDEKKAREFCLKKQEEEKIRKILPKSTMSLEELSSKIRVGEIKELKVILKCDVQGSLEAVKQILEGLETKEVKLKVIHSGIGAINTSDIVLATASDAIIFGFGVEADEKAKIEAEKEGVEIRTYNVIYELSNDLKKALEGLLEPKIKRIFLGRLEIKRVFKLSKAGTVAGCFVKKGKILRGSFCSLIRNGSNIYEGRITTLKRFKEDAKEVSEGFECGVTLENFTDFKEGDVIECFSIEKITRKL